MQNWKILAAPIYYRMRGLWMLGRKRHCPLCGGSFRRFLPKGTPPRPEALCPRCLSLERHRLLWLFLTRALRLDKKALSLLHFAPEPQMRRRLQAAALRRYVSCDIAPGRGNVAMDLTRLGFKSDSFDAVICSHVLEHVPKDGAALREIRRVLKTGGFAVLQVPLRGERTDEDFSVTDARQRLLRFGQEDHVRFYGRDFADRVRDAGFRVEVVEYAWQLSPSEIESCRLMAEGGDAEDWIFLAWKESPRETPQGFSPESWILPS